MSSIRRIRLWIWRSSRSTMACIFSYKRAASRKASAFYCLCLCIINMFVMWCLVTPEVMKCLWCVLLVESMNSFVGIIHSLSHVMHSLSFTVHGSGRRRPSVPGWVRKTRQFQDWAALDTRMKRSSYGKWIPTSLLRWGREWTPTGVSLAIPVYACCVVHWVIIFTSFIHIW